MTRRARLLRRLVSELRNRPRKRYVRASRRLFGWKRCPAPAAGARNTVFIGLWVL